MKVIYKYELGTEGETRIINDNIEKFLHVESQNGYPMVWAEVNLDEKSNSSWRIFCIGTGWDYPNEVFDGQFQELLSINMVMYGITTRDGPRNKTIHF